MRIEQVLDGATKRGMRRVAAGTREPRLPRALLEAERLGAVVIHIMHGGALPEVEGYVRSHWSREHQELILASIRAQEYVLRGNILVVTR